MLYNKTQFYSDEQNRPVTQYSIKQIVDNLQSEGSNKKHTYIELFRSCSQIQIVLFLRDFWYEINGWEVPTDNQMWNEVKQKYQEKKEKESV